MKKVLSFAMALAMLICLTSCRSDNADTSSSDGSSVSSAVSAPSETATPEPTETPTPIPTARPDGLWNVEGMTNVSFHAMPNGTLILYDTHGNQAMKYDPDKEAFSKLAQFEASQNVSYMSSERDNVLLLYNQTNGERLWLNVDTGEILTDDPNEKGGLVYEYDENGVLTARGTRFGKTEAEGLLWCEFPESYEYEGQTYTVFRAKLLSGRYVACFCILELSGDEPGSEYSEYYLMVYDLERQKASPVRKLSMHMGGIDACFHAVDGNILLLDGMVVDVSRMFESGYEPKKVDVVFDTVRQIGDTAYYCYGESLYALSAEGESQEIYRYTADERVIRAYAVTESGRVVVLVDEDPWHVKNGSVYVGDTCVCEEADYLIYADDSNIIVSKDGVLHLIPMP